LNPAKKQEQADHYGACSAANRLQEILCVRTQIEALVAEINKHVDEAIVPATLANDEWFHD
jgi:hypothetical protein